METMNEESVSEGRPEQIYFNFEGEDILCEPGQTILQAVWSAGKTLITNVGCLGQGVCGSCRILVRSRDEVDVRLACETMVEEGLDIHFVQEMEQYSPHRYQMDDFAQTWSALEKLNEVFPEAVDCRHCGGCDATCPRDLPVESGVQALVSGHLASAKVDFDACIMCDLCTYVCPEGIAPNHLILAARRVLASSTQRPANLLLRLQQIESGEMRVTLPGE